MTGSYTDGFTDALRAAARCCVDFAEDLDRRPEQARRLGANPSVDVRRLRQAASRIRDIPIPKDAA
ncbi:hypothetical protein ABC347_10795 [Sphingomonas sp. 1P06PA]|uniref:hypothetical protein n=1 Tax=Sphingomonas sp. 1P06PA TaxID=554121 RepID=UPI0039A75D95